MHYQKYFGRDGIEENRFLDLRHSFGVNSIQAGDNIKIVHANPGHALLHLHWMFIVMHPELWDWKAQPTCSSFMKT